jgi:hypothetical protein
LEHKSNNYFKGGYAFDRENPDGKFYCTQHFKLPPKDIKFVPKRLLHKQRQQELAAQRQLQMQQQQESMVQVETSTDENVDAMDNRGKTPERIEFENADAIFDGDPDVEQIMDENEWTDRNNFGSGSDGSDDEGSR